MKDKQAPSKAGRERRPDPRSVVRRIALEALMASDASGRFIDEVLGERIQALEGRDRHLLQEITYGTVRHRNTLDHLLNFHLKVPASQQRAPLRWTLRLGAYQLVYLGRIPAHAAVNQTLEGLKAVPDTGPREVGFVNAVLHKIGEEIRRKSQDDPIDRDDPTILPIRLGYCHFVRPVLPLYRMDLHAHLSIKYSHPAWLIARWLDRYGEEETRQLCDANNRSPQVIARVTKLAPSRDALLAALEAEGRKAGPGRLENSIVFTDTGDLEGSEAISKGWFQVQDETAIQIGAALSPPAGARILDLCSAPGGKAAQLLEQVGLEGHLMAADRSREKLVLLEKNLVRFGGNFTTSLLPENPEDIRLDQMFSHVLVDAPCSNTGVLARRPEARWRLRRDDMEKLASIQSGLLEAALRHLAPGGRLLYATCSIEPEENENIIARAFAKHGELVERETRLFLPHRTRGDGGFYSLLVRPR